MHHDRLSADRPSLGLLAVLAAFLWGGAGCERPPGSGSATGAKPRIALIMKSLANEFFLTMENGARAHQQRHAAGIVVVNTDNRFDDAVLAETMRAVFGADPPGHCQVVPCLRRC